MKSSKKALLLSAFVAPGVGHFYLKKYALGWVLLGAALFALHFILSHVVSSALAISDGIINGSIEADITVIRELIGQQSISDSAQQANTASIALFILWLIALLDCYRLGKSLQ